MRKDVMMYMVWEGGYDEDVMDEGCDALGCDLG